MIADRANYKKDVVKCSGVGVLPEGGIAKLPPLQTDALKEIKRLIWQVQQSISKLFMDLRTRCTRCRWIEWISVGSVFSTLILSATDTEMSPPRVGNVSSMSQT
jgi:hypothetical protein